MILRVLPALLVALLPGAAPADPLTLWTGAGLAGTAELSPGVAVPAGAHPCAGCHGWDGAGGGEGATRAPDIGRGALTARGYDGASFARALAEGRDPDGRVLARAMPRFRLPGGMAAALWDLTAPLEARRRHGVTATEVRLVLAADPGDATAAALAEAYVAAAGALQPVWGRRIEISVLVEGGAVADDAGVMAVIGPFPADPGGRAALEAGQVPMLHGFGGGGPLSLPLALAPDEELAALAGAARGAGVAEVTILGGDDTRRAAALRAFRRAGVSVAGAGGTPVLLSPRAEAPAGPLILPEAVLLARPDLAGRDGVISVPTLPFLAPGADPLAGYAEASLGLIAAALEEAGPDPTRRRLTEAATRLRAGLVPVPRSAP